MKKRMRILTAVLAAVLCTGQAAVMADALPQEEAADDTLQTRQEAGDEFLSDENGDYVIVEGAGRVNVTEKFFSGEAAQVDTYSLKRDGNKYLSDNFQVKEFACKDGTDEILIDAKLVETLQKIRDHFGAAVTITSGYRTPSHNKAVGGASNSYHMYGMAADIKVSGHTPGEVAAYAESIGVKGIGLYKTWVHVDTRRKSYSYFWNSVTGKTYEVKTFAPDGAKGDVTGNGRVTADDGLLVLRYVVGSSSLSSSQKTAADMNGDGEVDSVDALLILQKVVGIG